MQSFGDRCLHLIANGTGDALPMSDGIYRSQQMLTDICPDLHPTLYPSDFKGILTQVRRCLRSWRLKLHDLQDVKLPEPPITRVNVRPLEKYPMRSTQSAISNDAIYIALEESEIVSREADTPGTLAAVEAYKAGASRRLAACSRVCGVFCRGGKHRYEGRRVSDRHFPRHRFSASQQVSQRDGAFARVDARMLGARRLRREYIRPATRSRRPGAHRRVDAQHEGGFRDARAS